MSNSIKLPISNLLAGGDYTAQITLGTGSQTTANVILDTGSSTLSVHSSKFTHLEYQPTNLVQFVGYGTGSWAGPVVKTAVIMGIAPNDARLSSVYCAEIETGHMPNSTALMFAPADGILGLAYKNMNSAADVGANSDTYPLSNYDNSQKFHALPNKQNLPPFFSQLEEAGVSTNKFAFLTHRSNPYYGTANYADDPLNSGWFILGGGEEHTELYQGDFASVKVVHDQYYNTQLTSVQVGDTTEIPVPSLAQLMDEVTNQYAQSNPNIVQYYKAVCEGSVSNSIVDSGTNSITMFDQSFTALVNAFSEVNPKFGSAVQQGQAFLTSDDLKAWPTIKLGMTGENGEKITLEIAPETYWQTDAIEQPRYKGLALFKIESAGAVQAGLPNPLSILGLPLMNNYYVVFDRTTDNGVGSVKFAKKA